MADFDAFLEQLKTSLKGLAQNSFKKYSQQILHDWTEFAKKLEDDLQRWSVEYSIHEMTKEEFEFLVKGKKDLLEMEALKQLGLARTELNKLRNAIVDTITGTAVKVLL